MKNLPHLLRYLTLKSSSEGSLTPLLLMIFLPTNSFKKQLAIIKSYFLIRFKVY